MNHRKPIGNWKFILQSPARLAFVIALWIAAVASIPLHDKFEAPAWDVRIYLQAVDSVRHGHDPYADAIARQLAFHEARAKGETGPTPYSYVYAPITLPVIWLVAAMPLWVSAALYWALYAAGVLAQLWGTFAFASETERPIFLFFIPVAAFFPGLLASDIVWSGNVAFILYGAVLAAAWYGWKRDRWLLFYAVTIIASCFKAPLLTLLAIPVFSAKNQRLSAGIAALTGTVVFLSQSILAPQLFHHYLQAVELQFSYNRDFGSSPAGLFSGLLYDHGFSYSPASYIFYVAYAIPLCIVLLQLSKLYFAQKITLAQWVPTLMLGVILFNPRILEYDEIVLTIPIVLVVWRFFRAIASQGTAIVLSVATFAGLNLIAYQSWAVWKLTEGPLMVCCFSAGAWTLYRYAAKAEYSFYRAAQGTTSSERLSQL